MPTHQSPRRRSRWERFQAWTRWRLRTQLWGMDIHRSSWIERSALIDRTWPKGIHIAADVYVGEEAVVLTHDFTRGIYRDTHIGQRCLIGARSIIMPGCSVSHDCVVLPGAVVTKAMPPHSQACGNPARIEPRATEPI